MDRPIKDKKNARPFQPVGKSSFAITFFNTRSPVNPARHDAISTEKRVQAMKIDRDQPAFFQIHPDHLRAGLFLGTFIRNSGPRAVHVQGKIALDEWGSAHGSVSG